MSLTTMYPAKNNSPTTTLTAGLNSSDTTMTVDDASVLPSAPNLAVIGSSDDAEIVLYTAINGSNVTIVRGQNGTTPGTWMTGAPVARNFTALDHEIFRENILDLESRKADTSHTHDDRYYTETEMDTTLGSYATLASPALTGTPTAPTASSSTNTTQIATTAFVQGVLKPILYYTGVAVSAVNGTIIRLPSSGTNSLITTDTVVLECTFSDASKISSSVSWESFDGYVRFTGTCASAITANIVLGTKGN